ncbi:hypothetical protein HELRODRAFT_133471, partial [Helobdella robusta]|uniref:Ectonucleoside triphosphate diphosphohydrolase 5 n=1 Tax=Helobdella robusta TaxID=6412 RepID=T1EI10_HELRO
GSTGSRIHVFKFQSYVSNDSLILEDSYFKSIKPGLSSYAKSPKLAAESLEPLLRHAKKYVPKHLWSSTPLALKATAGLRLLPQKASDNILAEVKKLFESYPFDLSADGVSIMKGDDEGLFSWFTVNFLNDNFNELSKTVGVLDLGGGSTQITFIPKATELLQYQGHPHIVHRKLFGDQITIYTHSYLGLGMMSARFQILGGTEQTKSRWHLCNKEVKNLISKYKIDKSFSIQNSEFYAISYFFD